MDTIDPICKCGHPRSDHVGIVIMIPPTENPKDHGSGSWKKIHFDSETKLVVWMNEDRTAGCMRTPSGMRCHCAEFKAMSQIS